MWAPKSSPYSKSNSFWPDFSTGIASFSPCSRARCRDVGAELLVDQHAGRAGLGAALDRLQHALEDQPLGVGDRLGLLRRRIALDPEHLLLEGPAMVEREDVQLAVVAEGHGTVLRSFSSLSRV